MLRRCAGLVLLTMLIGCGGNWVSTSKSDAAQAKIHLLEAQVAEQQKTLGELQLLVEKIVDDHAKSQRELSERAQRLSDIIADRDRLQSIVDQEKAKIAKLEADFGRLPEHDQQRLRMLADRIKAGGKITEIEAGWMKSKGFYTSELDDKVAK